MNNESAKAPETAPARVIGFAPFALDVRAAELRKHGVKVRLPQQSFQVLVILLDHAGEVVLRDQIRDALWPDGTVVEFDHSINAAVKNLRSALGDSAGVPRYIETVGRQGYRFIAQLDTETTPAPTPSPEKRAEQPGRKLAVAVALAVVAGILWWLAPGRPDDVLEPVPLTTYMGEEITPSFSPDGNQVAFSWKKDPGGQAHIYAKLIGPGDPLPLTSDQGNHSTPAWSPDGKWVAFVGRHADGRGGVYLVPALGGPERLLVENEYVDSLSWSPDGKWLAAGPNNLFNERGVVVFSTENGDRKELAQQYPELKSANYPRFSPDGRRLAYMRGKIWSTQIYVVDLTSDLRLEGKPKQVTFDEMGALNPEWTADGREIVYMSGSSRSNGALARVIPDGRGKSRKIPGLGAAPGRIAVARKGGRMAFQRGGDDADIWRYDLQGIEAPARWASSTLYENNADYSPDGKRIAMSSNRSGSREIWVTDADGGNAQQFTHFGGPTTGTPRWSPDGKWIAFDSRPGGDPEIFVIGAEGSGLRRLTSEPGEDARPAWSPDGKWIYFSSERTGRLEIWRLPAEGGAAVQLTRGGGSTALPAPDGEWVYYKAQDLGSGLRKMRTDGSGDTKAVDGHIAFMGYALTARALWFINYGQSSTVETIRFADGSRTKALDLPFRPDNGLSLTPDERYVLLTKPDDRGTDLVLVEGFR